MNLPRRRGPNTELAIRITDGRSLFDLTRYLVYVALAGTRSLGTRRAGLERRRGTWPTPIGRSIGSCAARRYRAASHFVAAPTSKRNSSSVISTLRPGSIIAARKGAPA